MPTIGNPRKTIRIADVELRTWLEEKAKAEGVTETDVILHALRTLQLLDAAEETGIRL